MFPGSNVHGVLPVLRDRFHNTERVRLTLNFAFWVDRPCVFGNIVTQNDTYVEQITHSKVLKNENLSPTRTATDGVKMVLERRVSLVIIV